MGKKSDAAEIDRRFMLVKTIVVTKTTATPASHGGGGYSSDKPRRTATRQREINTIIERSDFLGTRPALLDEIIEASIRSKQHSNSRALKLQQLTRLLEGARC